MKESIERAKEKLEWRGKPEGKTGGRNVFGTLAKLLIIAAILGLIFFFVNEPVSDNGGGNGTDGGGTFRSCIKRVLSDTPSCEPPSGTGSMKTILNGKDIGTCNVVGNNGCIQR